MIAVSSPAGRVADTLSSACTAASPAPYVLLTPTARAAAVVELSALARLVVVVTDMALLEHVAAGVAARSHQETTARGPPGSGWSRRQRCPSAAESAEKCAANPTRQFG